jgi:thiol-disulfide isomerase/thioredoxin
MRSACHSSLVTCHCIFLLLLSPYSMQAIQAPVPPQAQSSPEAQETQALQDAVRSAEDNPQLLIKNLEGFLKRFPASLRREQVIDVIYTSALRANDPQTAIEYGEQVLERRPDDSALLASLVDELDRQGDASSHAKALEYATRLVDRGEAKYQEAARNAPETVKAADATAIALAQACLTRGKLYAEAGNLDKAEGDYEKSYAVYPSQQLAERLGDLAVKKNDLGRAVDEYTTAFAFPGPGLDPAERQEVRRKLGSTYLAMHRSEKGLGDTILARYDELTRALAARFQDSGQPNADLRDPFAYVLKRTDGSPLPLADYRGKILVLEFWATWCGPCRLEGRLLESVTEKFRNQPGAVFLAVNVDENRGDVPAFVKEEQWTTPVVYSQGLDRLLGVISLPTLVIFDRSGHVVFRQEGLVVTTFVDTVEKKVRGALGQSVAAGSR